MWSLLTSLSKLVKASSACLTASSNQGPGLHLLARTEHVAHLHASHAGIIIYHYKGAGSKNMSLHMLGVMISGSVVDYHYQQQRDCSYIIDRGREHNKRAAVQRVLMPAFSAQTSDEGTGVPGWSARHGVSAIHNRTQVLARRMSSKVSSLK